MNCLWVSMFLTTGCRAHLEMNQRMTAKKTVKRKPSRQDRFMTRKAARASDVQSRKTAIKVPSSRCRTE